MNEEKLVWTKSMADPPFVNRQFTADLKHKVLQRTDESHRKRFSILKVVCVPFVIVSLVLGLLHLKEEALPSMIDPQDKLSGGLETRNTYYEQGRLLFTLNPEPYAKAGKTSGYMIHFEEPLKTFMGKTLTLYAVHKLSGVKETVSSEVITKPSPGYSGLDRYTTRFALPLEGMWDLHVMLDDKPYGNVQLFMLELSWEITPEFKSGNYLIRGVEKQVGFIDAGFIADKPQKYMWHFWGNEDLLNGPVEVKAIKQGTNNMINVYSSNPISSAHALAGELNGADRHVVTSMKLPEAGRWRLLPYVKGRLLDTIVVEVRDESSTNIKRISGGNVVTARPLISPNHLSYDVTANPNDTIHVTVQKMKTDEIFEDLITYAETLSSEGISESHQHEGAGKYKLVIEDKSNNTTTTHIIVVPES